MALTRQLLESLEGQRERPTGEDLAAMRAGLAQWETALDGLRRRVAALTVSPHEWMHDKVARRQSGRRNDWKHADGEREFQRTS